MTHARFYAWKTQELPKRLFYIKRLGIGLHLYGPGDYRFGTRRSRKYPAFDFARLALTWRGK